MQQEENLQEVFFSDDKMKLNVKICLYYFVHAHCISLQPTVNSILSTNAICRSLKLWNEKTRDTRAGATGVDTSAQDHVFCACIGGVH